MKIFFLSLLFLSGLFVIFLFFEREFWFASEVAPLPEPEIPTVKEAVKIILVGDIILDRGVEHIIKKEGGGDYKFPFLKIADYLKTADIVFGNIEGPISDKGRKVGTIYSFRHDPEAIDGLVFGGFDVLSFANNHAFDYTLDALEDNFLRLKNNGIDYVGAGFNAEEAFSPVIKEAKGVKIAFLAYTNLGSAGWAATEQRGGIAWVGSNDLEKVKQDIAKAKSEADVLIISMHVGEEYTQNITEFQNAFAKTAIDSGADLVAGHHPHVVQKSEQYKGKWIFYSLGNFIFDQDFSEETMQGGLLEVLIESGSIRAVNSKTIKMNNFFQPEIQEKVI